ncbi:MAG TPA: type II toxin-antitoxin system HicA family toxin [Bryobacteraceae bacterium]|nr:type II toxin-antitoxin system HicA family toxin [Bryobacteraceae bacterium]
MSQKEKALARLKAKPKDFTCDELKTVMEGFGYKQLTGSGSRRKFYREETKALISLHQPHPGRILKAYQVRDLLNHLREQKLI